jgi:la-related protein 1
MVAPSLSAPALSYADRAKKSIRQNPDPPQKPQPANVWDKRKEELAAKTRSPAASSSSSPKADPVVPPSDHTDDDDPFVVRSSRAPRLPAPLPSTESADDWPQVGKSLPPSSSASDTAKPDDSRTESRKGTMPLAASPD